MFAFSVLGPVAATRDGHPAPLPAGKATELLVRLALDAGRLVATDRLVEDLWDGASRTRRNTVQSKVAMLRRALGAPTVVVGGDGGYRLAVDPGAVDALAVLAATAQASRLLADGSNDEASTTSDRALAMFRGEVLPSAGDGGWVVPHRTALEEARRTLIEIGFSARLRRGGAGELVAGLEQAVATHPFQERLCALLMTALYRAGRQADALATYARVRAHLADELGLEPGPELRAVELQILTHDPALDGPRRPESIGLTTAIGAPSSNVPSLATELFGRERELGELSASIAENRLVEIVGPGGIGKTALALATGRSFTPAAADRFTGVWLVRLEGASNADDVVDAVAAALDVTGGQAALVERLRVGAPLVILDNCEHVVDAAAAFTVGLLDAVPRLHILCTSQIALDVEGEVVFELDPLSLADSVRLFVHRAASGRVQDDDPSGPVGKLCRSLDGLPLAIELAAARTKTLSVDEITRRLDDRFTVLADPTSRRPERRRALRSTIRWSYDLLFPDDQRGLWALATFADGAPLAAVEHVLEALGVPRQAAIDVVGRLASRSLVIVDDQVRYRLLDSIRAYALEAMAEARHTADGFRAHAEWFAVAATTSTAGVRSGRQAEHLAFARSERANIDGALAWCMAHAPGRALDIANGFGWAWVVLGDSRGAQRLLTALHAAGATAPDRDRVSALLLAGWIEASTGHLDRALAHVTEATEIAERIDDTELRGRCLYHLAYVVSHDGDFRLGLELTDRSRALYDGLDAPWDQVANGLFATRAAISAGDAARATVIAEQLDSWLRVVDDPWLHVRREAMLGELARVERRFDDAVVHIARAVETSQRLGFLQTAAYQRASLGRAQCQAGDHEAGSATLDLAVEQAEAIGDVRMAALARVHLGRVLRALGDDRRARSALESASAWHRREGGGEQAALGECLLAAMDGADGDPTAEHRLGALLEQARRDGDAPVAVFALDGLARLVLARDGVSAALVLLDAADQQMIEAGHFITELDRVDARHVRDVVADEAAAKVDASG